MPISTKQAWIMGAALALLMVIIPTIHYRQTYRFAKRLRTVTENKVYRSGCLTADGVEAAVKEHGIKTVLNLQDESPDPDIPNHYFTFATTPESEVCRKLGVKFVYMPVELVNGREFPEKHAPTVDSFLKMMDDPATYPILIHCRAGLHRTGVLVALYRQEYEGWTPHEALRELKSHGFGEFVSSAANPYIVQYVLGYQPRAKEERKGAGDPGSGGENKTASAVSPSLPLSPAPALLSTAP